MNMSPEMKSYVQSGRCPRCDAVLLSDEYLRAVADRLEQAAARVAQNLYGWTGSLTPIARTFGIKTERMADEELLVGSQPQVEFITHGKYRYMGDSAPNGMQCLICMQSWPIAPKVMTAGPLALRRALAAREIEIGADAPHSIAARSLNLSGCRMTSVRDIAQMEMPLRRETRIYPNNTGSSTLTKRVGISNPVSRTVTIESSKLRAHNAQAGVTIVGFAEIQGQVQQQLGERYSVATGDTITISEETTIQIPPGSVIEHTIQWKVVYEFGLAVLGQPLDSRYGQLAEVPYRVPMRLTYSDDINDAPTARKRSK